MTRFIAFVGLVATLAVDPMILRARPGSEATARVMVLENRSMCADLAVNRRTADAFARSARLALARETLQIAEESRRRLEPGPARDLLEDAVRLQRRLCFGSLARGEGAALVIELDRVIRELRGFGRIAAEDRQRVLESTLDRRETAALAAVEESRRREWAGERGPRERNQEERGSLVGRPIEKVPIEKVLIERGPVGKRPVEKRLVEKRPVERSPAEKGPEEKGPEEKAEKNRPEEKARWSSNAESTSRSISGSISGSTSGSTSASTSAESDVVRSWESLDVGLRRVPKSAPRLVSRARSARQTAEQWDPSPKELGRRQRLRQAALRERVSRWQTGFERDLASVAAARAVLGARLETRSLEQARSECVELGRAAAGVDYALVLATPESGLRADLDRLLAGYVAAGRWCAGGRFSFAWLEIEESDRRWARLASNIRRIDTGRIRE